MEITAVLPTASCQVLDKMRKINAENCDFLDEVEKHEITSCR